jgi:hypothetical protein
MNSLVSGIRAYLDYEETRRRLLEVCGIHVQEL